MADMQISSYHREIDNESHYEKHTINSNGIFRQIYMNLICHWCIWDNYRHWNWCLHYSHIKSVREGSTYGESTLCRLKKTVNLNVSLDLQILVKVGTSKGKKPLKYCFAKYIDDILDGHFLNKVLNVLFFWITIVSLHLIY